MKKINKILIFIVFIILPFNIKALEVNGYITKNDTLIASEANKTVNGCNFKENDSYSSVYASPNKLRCLDSGEMVTILDTSIIPSTIEVCNKGYYYVSFLSTLGNKYNGYVCADYIQTEIDKNKYAEEFINAGFPESYFEKLTLLKDNHPNWKFTAFKTNLNWNDVLDAESTVGMSYIQTSNPIYLSLEEGSYNVSTNTYNMLEPGGWYAANKATIAYYLDPRNFLTEKEIFMFENQGFNEKYQTIEVLKTILANTDLLEFASIFLEAATYEGNNISPILLAARSRQEVVKSDGTLSNSASGTVFKETPVYNFYNWGAYSSGCEIDGNIETNPVQCALYYAYLNNWIDARTAILEGSKPLSNSYLKNSQNTLYFQKFNVTNNIYGNYSHQYMTNIQAPLSEANSSYNAYSQITGLLDSEIEFIIPVYENIPNEVSLLPTKVDTETIENKKEIQTEINISEIISESGYVVNGDYLVSVSIGTTANEVLSKIQEQLTGEINITILKNNTNISGSEVLGTSDILMIKTSENEVAYRIIVNGDINGDGVITPADYVKIKNHIMNVSELNGAYMAAADVNKDGSITPADYVNVKNYIMGISSTLK